MRVKQRADPKNLKRKHMNTKRLIDIDEGRIVEMTEMGELPVIETPPPRIRNPGVKAGIRKKSEHPATFKNDHTGRANSGRNFKARDHIPGYREWLSERQRQVQAYMVERSKSRLGVPDGMRRKEADENLKRAGIVNQAPSSSDEEYAEEALTATLQVMHGPHCDRLKLKAARQIIEWTKPRPAKKAKVSIRPSEEWLAALDDDAAYGE